MRKVSLAILRALSAKDQRRSAAGSLLSSRIPLLLVLLAVMSMVGVYGQTTSGSISGEVVDQQQSAVGGATVSIRDESRGFAQTATTDAAGRFVFPQLSPGTYVLMIEAKGFKKTQRTDLHSEGLQHRQAEALLLLQSRRSEALHSADGTDPRHRTNGCGTHGRLLRFCGQFEEPDSHNSRLHNECSLRGRHHSSEPAV